MAVSAVSKRRRLRGFVLYRGSAKHSVAESVPGIPRQESVKPRHHGLNKASASAPRLSGPYERLSTYGQRVA